MTLAGVGTITFTGRSGAGTISNSDVVAGDLLVVMYGSGPDFQINPSDISTKVSTTGQIKQESAADYSTTTFTAIVIRPC